jgi:DNA-directed RNA polymerase specialized sigma24 family protein
MSDHPSIQELSLAVIARRCSEETERFFLRQDHDSRFGYELFRRAIVDRSEPAWHLVYAQYRPLVAGWVQRHSAFPRSGEEVQYFVNRTFEKMWHAVTPQKFGSFTDLKSLLRYLQVCVHSAILDRVRKPEPPQIEGVNPTTSQQEVTEPSPDELALDEAAAEELWQLVNRRLRDEKEYVVVYGSFVLALKPRELCQRFDGQFSGPKEVYRIKENVLSRLRRDPQLREILAGDA